MKTERVIFSGAGGQGLMFIGKLFANMAIDKFPFLTFIPSYGAEIRGGTSNCRIILSGEEIASPVVEEADAMLVMNQPSADRFLPMLIEGGSAFINSSLVETPSSKKWKIVDVPATEWAQELGDIRCANMIMLGAYLCNEGIFDCEKVGLEIEKIFIAKGKDVGKLNVKAFLRGWNHAR
ncbi:MAG: 2-oxoacid:acceptor oxidoreductase family protein [Kiritimatiellae bacterium]|nr:2-oxoacid:acceptor oxidoreductase family protein [Kiritimatiellia bacterium]